MDLLVRNAARPPNSALHTRLLRGYAAVKRRLSTRY
jgi:hypothetical protein